RRLPASKRGSVIPRQSLRGGQWRRVMRGLSPSTVGKIGKLIPRLASDHDGEVVATARAIVRTLASSGHDLHDVVTTLDKPPVERIVYRDRIIDKPVSS